MLWCSCIVEFFDLLEDNGTKFNPARLQSCLSLFSAGGLWVVSNLVVRNCVTSTFFFVWILIGASPVVFRRAPQDPHDITIALRQLPLFTPLKVVFAWPLRLSSSFHFFPPLSDTAFFLASANPLMKTKQTDRMNQMLSLLTMKAKSKTVQWRHVIHVHSCSPKSNSPFVLMPSVVAFSLDLLAWLAKRCHCNLTAAKFRKLSSGSLSKEHWGPMLWLVVH
jgi:hypothetical protein